MINREDMLELTRRMTPARTSFTRIAGCYLDGDGEIDGTFNLHFLKLSPQEKTHNLAIAKAIPFAETNENLKEYQFSKEAEGSGSMWQMLRGLNTCGLKNDALMETFYELVAEQYETDEPYAIMVFHDIYDIPVKAADKERLGESEEVFQYLICAICPLEGEYEPGRPECGFLFPSFRDRSGDPHRVAIFHRDKDHPHREIEKLLLTV
ncbi:DUF4317 family protein [Hespellia stercorisuis]|uniref:DUF4317 family protein n=1 Tax=Hespellia stercorisuis DSM 15480 TaxID=1121950 RepID=A0A1M6MXL3_9FIRM|nr:DUF4317 family protein [Hespellia stercorisuis]SHJ88152.1 protein of unknown function [Hespellia stercorisuis DSM 15480]